MMMVWRWMVVAILCPLGSLASGADLAALYRDSVFPIFENACYDCHGDGVKKGELALDAFPDIASMQADREVWKRIRAHIDQRLMPPPDEPPLPDADREALIRWIDEAVFPVDPDKPDPGRVTLRRLNRVEYENTIRDLLGVRVDVAGLLPPDDTGYGFDNIGDVLTLSPSHLERLLEAARVALDAATHPDPMPLPAVHIEGERLQGDGRPDAGGRVLHTNGTTRTVIEVPKSGRFRLVVTAGGEAGPAGRPEISVTAGGKNLGQRQVKAAMDEPEHLVFPLRLAAAEPLDVEISFLNDSYDPNQPDPARRDCNLRIARVSLVGPLDGPPVPKPESHRRIYGDRPAGASDEQWAAEVFRRFARRAFRRPPEPGEAERYTHFLEVARESKLGVEHGIRFGLEAMLVSPAFLFREEPQPEPDKADRIHAVNEHTLATRLSYFLWSTMPDDQLIRLADEGKLHANLDQQVARMLESPKAGEFTRHFTGQWLQLRDLPSARPAPHVFRRFSGDLRGDMRRETEMLFAHLIREDRPLVELLEADYSFLNERLARHYGIRGVTGGEFRRVPLEGTPRRGILGHGSFHLLTSHPLRTSPVLRGKFVLENLLDISPPPPPPNVPQLTPPEQHGEGLTLRQQMERHREDPNCSSCHALMDPIGFGLEHFDADGSWRDTENGRPINASGELIGGRAFTGADELRQILLAEYRAHFHRSVASKLLTYALGRGVDWYDKPAIDAIVRETERNGGGTRAMIHAVIHSVPFQYRRGDP